MPNLNSPIQFEDNYGYLMNSVSFKRLSLPSYQLLFNIWFLLVFIYIFRLFWHTYFPITQLFIFFLFVHHLAFVVHKSRGVTTLSTMHMQQQQDPLMPARLRQAKEKSNTETKADERGLSKFYTHIHTFEQNRSYKDIKPSTHSSTYPTAQTYIL